MALTIAISGCPFVDAFSSGPSVTRSPDRSSSLRGTVSEFQQEQQLPGRGAFSSSLAPLAAFAGAAVLSSKLRGNRQSRAVVRSAAAADLAEEPVEEIFDPSQQLGVTSPIGFFDPLGFTQKGDAKGFRDLREQEIKHGRVAMLASIGAVAQHYIVFPGFDNVPRCMDALNSPLGTWGFAVVAAVSGWFELEIWSQSEDKEPGNFGDPFGVNMYNEDMRNKELNNGRAAMIATLGIVAANLATGKDAIQQFGF